MIFTTNDNRHFKRIDHPFYGNQHITLSRRKKPQNHKPTKPLAGFRAFLALIFFFSVLIYKGMLTIQEAEKPVHIISPLASSAYASEKKVTPTPTSTSMPTVTPTPADQQYNLIHKDIEQVFGKYAPKAFELLQSPTCHENGKLNPMAKNVNTDQWHSTDWGVFQINDHWQNIGNPAFLTDYDINIRIAWRIFVNNGYRFGIPPSGGWTCGRVLGI